MVTYTELDAYRERNRNRRTVILEGTVESGDSAGNVALVAADAGLNSIETVIPQTTVVGAGNALLDYDSANDQIDFYDQDLSANTTTLTDDTFVVKVTGPVE